MPQIQLPSMVPLLLVILLLCSLVTSASLRFEICLWNVLNGTSLEGVVYSNGSQVTNLTLGTGLAYHRCTTDCGAGPSSFDWFTFSTQCTSWLLPLLALIPQIPYGTKDGLSNFLAVLLTVGSPTLAAYSLSLTVITHRWMVKRFERSTYPNSRLAARILGDLQQVFLELPEDESVMPSLIVLEMNRGWWQKLSEGLDYSVPKWTLASIVSIIYVVLADAFSWSNSLGISLAQTPANGEGISSLWLCFLPIVIGNLQISPKSDTHRIRKAFDAANEAFYVATDGYVPRQARANSNLSVNIRETSKTAIDEDEICSAPIFFYARVLSCIHVADQIANAFGAASRHASDHNKNGVPPSRRLDVIEYCRPEDQVDGYYYEIFSIFLRSAFLANFLQWGTTGATIMAIYLTPTKGLSCRSGSFLIYGCASTLVWLLCVVSSVLSHSYNTYRKPTTISRIIWVAAITLRHAAKTLATANALWLFLSAVLQFSNVFDNCWCNSGVLALHHKAYFVIESKADQAVSQTVRHLWAAGLIMSLLTATLFLLAINLLRRHPA